MNKQGRMEISIAAFFIFKLSIDLLLPEANKYIKNGVKFILALYIN